MRNIQMIKSEVPSKKVEFYPSVDDHVHIANRLSSSVPTSTLTVYSYYAFLFLNTIVFPVFLWFNEYLLAGLIVFLLNILTLMFIVPRANSDSYRKYYEHLYGNRENEIATVELSSAGINYYSDGAETFWPWQRINSIEETDQSIYFFHEGNGFAVSKSGFAYPHDSTEFIDFARNSLTEVRTKQIET